MSLLIIAKLFTTGLTKATTPSQLWYHCYRLNERTQPNDSLVGERAHSFYKPHISCTYNWCGTKSHSLVMALNPFHYIKISSIKIVFWKVHKLKMLQASKTEVYVCMCPFICPCAAWMLGHVVSLRQWHIFSLHSFFFFLCLREWAPLISENRGNYWLEVKDIQRQLEFCLSND